MKIYIAFFFLLLTVCYGCIPSPGFSDVPSLKFIGLSKSTMVQGDLNNDSITVTLSFTDGDGDIGSTTRSNIINLFVIDNRTGNPYDEIKLPEIPQEGANNGVEGTIYLKLYNGCCLFPDRPNCTPSPGLFDTISFDIYIRDKALQESNRVTTDLIVLMCQ